MFLFLYSYNNVDDCLTLYKAFHVIGRQHLFYEAFFSKYKFVLIDYFLQFGETLHPPVLHVSQRALTL